MGSFKHTVSCQRLALIRAREVPAWEFRSFLALLAVADALFLVLGWRMLALATMPEPREAAIAQIAVSVGRLALRGAFFPVGSEAGSRAVPHSAIEKL